MTNLKPGLNDHPVLLLSLLLCTILFLTSTLRAQEETPQGMELTPWVQLTLYQVQPTMVEEFRAVQREFKALAEKAETPWRSVSSTAVFGHLNRFIVVTPVENLGSFDQSRRPSPELSSLNNRLERCISSRQDWAVYVVPDMSKPPPVEKEPQLLVVNLAKIYPGREQDYSRLMVSDFLPHFDENDVPYLSGSLAFGGETGFIHFFYFDNFAALDEGSPVMRELGAEGAQAVMSRFSGIVSSNELWIARYLPELSIRPKIEKTSAAHQRKR